MKACFETVTGACGVGVAYYFGDTDYSDYEIAGQNPGGAGWLCAGFIKDDKICDKAFGELADKYKVVFITPPRKNVNSGNDFYFAVFDTKGSGVPTGFDECDSL